MSRIRDDDPRVVLRIGAQRTRTFRPSDWYERDNFRTYPEADAYARHMARQHPPTPYRVVRLSRRYAVEYVPSWVLG